MSKKKLPKEEYLFGGVARMSPARQNKFCKDVADLVVQNLKLKLVAFQMDQELNTMADMADSKHPQHKRYLKNRRRLEELESKRRGTCDLLRPYGIDLR
jgi:hypothetical protein